MARVHVDRRPLAALVLCLALPLSGCKDKLAAILPQLLTALAASSGGMRPGGGMPGSPSPTMPGSPGFPGFPNPSSAIGSLPGSPAPQGMQPMDSGTIRGSNGSYRVPASTFDNQKVAGTTPEDGDQRLDPGERGVALPSRRALGKVVGLRLNGRTAYATVIDVGPWYTDDPYWETGTAPKAMQNKGQTKTGTLDGDSGAQKLTINGAAIDLTPTTRNDLGTSSGMVEVEWWFASQAELASQRPV